jgi:hypothetical protein
VAAGKNGVSGFRDVATRTASAGALLLLAYVLLSLPTDPDGFLGPDTGAKIHTLHVMERDGTASPDIGYWAEEHDPAGDLHPVHHTNRQPDGSWVAVTTLPMLELARPLYALGGYSATLILPMLGGVAAAFAARQIVRRLDPGNDGWLAFWVIGLGSPILVYALDFWEHTVGVACVLWAVALLLGVVEEVAPRWTAAGAGILLGVGATLRQEVLIYTLVLVVASCGVLLARRRNVIPPLLTGAYVVVGFAVPWVLNAWLEASVEGQSRAGRSSGTASAAVSGVTSDSTSGDRVGEGLQTFIGLVAGDPALSALLGAAVVGAIVMAARAERRDDRGFALVGLGAAAAVYLADAIGGLGFVPGMLTAFPLAVGGLLAWSRRPRLRAVVVGALVALPIVYAFQFLGGGAPQWGGRYTLTSGMLLALAALVGLPEHRPVVLRGLVVLSVAVTALGYGWLVQRSHGADRFFERLEEEAEPVVVARQAFLLREAGAVAVDQRWFSVEDEAEFTRAVDIVREIDEDRFTVLEWESPAPPDDALPDDVREVRRSELTFVNTPVGVVTYEFTD